MSGTYDLPNAKETVMDVLNQTPDDLTIRDMRRLINQELRKRDDHTRDVSVDLWAGFAVLLVGLAAVVYAVNI